MPFHEPLPGVAPKLPDRVLYSGRSQEPCKTFEGLGPEQGVSITSHRLPRNSSPMTLLWSSFCFAILSLNKFETHLVSIEINIRYHLQGSLESLIVLKCYHHSLNSLLWLGEFFLNETHVT